MDDGSVKKLEWVVDCDEGNHGGSAIVLQWFV